MGFTEKQLEFFDNCNHRYNVKSGATRAGKTYMDYFLIPKRIAARKDLEGLNVILGVSKGTITRNIIEPLQNIWGASLVSDISANNTATIMGEKVYCIGASKINQVAQLRGSSIKYVYCDEVVEYNEEVFQMLKSRLDKPYSLADLTCNPENPTHWFKKFLETKADIYLQEYTIFDNPYLPKERVEELCNEYKGTIYYERYILGKWKRAEGAIYKKFADNPKDFIVDDNWLKENPIVYGIMGVDFGGTKSAHSFTFTGFTKGYKELVVIKEYYKKERISPEVLETDFILFCRDVLSKYKCYECYMDSAEQTLITGLESRVLKERIPIQIKNARKNPINDRIKFTIAMMGTDRFKIHESCVNTIDALSNAVYDSKQATKDIRLDDGVMNVDSLDSMEYSFESIMKEIQYAK